MKKKELGLALGGGGLKGLAHIGVLQVLEANKIPVAMISRTSVGSIFAALYASGMSPKTMEKVVINTKVKDYIDYNLAGILSYALSLALCREKNRLDGLILGNKLEKLIYDLTDGKRLTDIKMPIAIIACDIDSGKRVIFTNQNLEAEDHDTIIIKDELLSKAVRASISIPGTFVPITLNGLQLVDGGLKNIVPVGVQKIMGAGYIMTVNLRTEADSKRVNGILHIISRTIEILIAGTSDKPEKFLSDLIIFPDTGYVNLTDIHRASQIIEYGRKAMKNSLEKLMDDLVD